MANRFQNLLLLKTSSNLSYEQIYLVVQISGRFQNQLLLKTSSNLSYETHIFSGSDFRDPYHLNKYF